MTYFTNLLARVKASPTYTNLASAVNLDFKVQGTWRAFLVGAVVGAIGLTLVRGVFNVLAFVFF